MAFEEELNDATTPGPGRIITGAVVIAADKSGKPITVHTSGTTSIDPATASPITLDSTMWIASCTKLMTTIAALQCVERGQLSLDADVSTILPEWKAPEILTGFDEKTGEPVLVKATKKITLRHLLTHSSGMGYDFLSPMLQKWRAWTGIDAKSLEGDVQKAYVMPLIFEPGDGWNYSCAIDWAGQMVERVNNNQRLGDYLQEHIWGPLGMTLTTFQLAQHESVRKNLCVMTLRTPGTGELVPTPALRNTSPKDDLGGGGLYSCANDYIKVLVAVLQNDGVLLKPDTVAQMFTPQLEDPKHIQAVVSEPVVGPMFTNGVTGCEAWNFGLGGILNSEDVEGVANKGAMTWGGLPNLFWWIDPIGGHCGLYASQIVPPGDPASLNLALEFRKEVFRGVKL